MSPEQRETIENAAAILDGTALEMRMCNAMPPSYDVIQEPEVAAEHMKIKRIVKQLYDIAQPSNSTSDTPAEGGANNVRSSAPESLQTIPPSGGAVVVEQPGPRAPARSDVNQHQPAPVSNTHPAVWPLVIEDMAARDAVGRERYGVPLQPHNGRDALIDAYQEALDLCAYLRQAIYERDGK